MCLCLRIFALVIALDTSEPDTSKKYRRERRVHTHKYAGEHNRASPPKVTYISRTIYILKRVLFFCLSLLPYGCVFLSA